MAYCLVNDCPCRCQPQEKDFCHYSEELAELQSAAQKSGQYGLSPDDIEYPRDIFRELIDENSPYAFYLFQWVPYQKVAKRWRLKMMHDAKAFDGREVHSVWPNGDSFGELKDDEIEFIRISRNQGCHVYEDPRGG